MDDALQYVSVISLCGTLCGTAIAFIVGLFKWIDQRKREQDQKHYEAFHRMVCLASGTDENGRTVKWPQQLAAIYQLQAYKKYAFASVPVLKAMQSDTSNVGAEHLREALATTIAALSNQAE